MDPRIGGADMARPFSCSGDGPRLMDARSLLSAMLLIMLVTLPSASRSDCKIPPAGMVGWWPLDEVFPSPVADLANNNNGIQTNGIYAIPGVVNGAYYFGDNYTNYVEVPPSQLYNVGYYITIDAWIRPHARTFPSVWTIRPILDAHITGNGYEDAFGA